VPTELIVYPREEHGIRERPHLLDMSRRVLAWIDRYLSPPQG
jgi:dipeptidyl aminopeptidase/acylaminoacyl peptidase